MGKSINLATDIAVNQVVIRQVEYLLISAFSHEVRPSVNWIVMSGVQGPVDVVNRDVLGIVYAAVFGTSQDPPAEFNIDKFVREQS
jgi:hypothetical protein